MASGNKGPIGAKKDVGIRADRADGFVLRNMTVRHVNEHAIYVLESRRLSARPLQDLLRGRVRRAHVRGGPRPDAELRGRRAAATRACTRAPAPRAGTSASRARAATRRRSASATCTTTPRATRAPTATRCWVHHNNFYDNALGFTTDVFTAAGHPGFPQDSDLIEHNKFYSNNFNVYAKGSDVEPRHAGAGGHRPVDRGRKPQHHPAQPLLEQLAPRRDDLRGARPRAALRPARGHQGGVRRAHRIAGRSRATSWTTTGPTTSSRSAAGRTSPSSSSSTSSTRERRRSGAGRRA